MLLKTWIIIQLVQFSLCSPKKSQERKVKPNFERLLETFLEGEYETNTSAVCNEAAIASWSYSIDISNTKKEKLSTELNLKQAKIQEYFYQTYFKGLSPKNFTSVKMKRLIKSVTIRGDGALPPEKYERLTNVINEMGAIYSKAKVCPFTNQQCDLRTEGLSQDPGIEERIFKSRNLDELAYLWTAWRDASGKKMRNLYQEYVILKNEAAVLDGFKDAAEAWKDEYETPNLERVIDQLWNEIEPFYDDLHFYVRSKLQAYYGSQLDLSDELLPADITGDLYAQNWLGLMPIVIPFPKVAPVDITPALKARNFTVLNMFETANDFYKSMGLPDASMAFGKKAMIERPAKRDVVCHATAWEFCDAKDFRISMCTKVNEDDFSTIHHELGHIHYYLQYKKHLHDFRGAPNPGFHEAIGDAIVLSVMNPIHLQKIGLIDTYDDSKEAEINALMFMALKLIAFIPFGLTVDKWRWDVFSGKCSQDEWNDRWWYYRSKIQKLRPPNKRTSMDFDPGSKYHIPSDTQYLAYFVAHIVEFQIYRGMCIAAGQYKPGGPVPLHNCDFYQSEAAGKRLASGLKLGSSVHWSVVLKKITGESELSTSAIMDYFQPLRAFLQEQNIITKEKRGGVC